MSSKIEVTEVSASWVVEAVRFSPNRQGEVVERSRIKLGEVYYEPQSRKFIAYDQQDEKSHRAPTLGKAVAKLVVGLVELPQGYVGPDPREEES